MSVPCIEQDLGAGEIFSSWGCLHYMYSNMAQPYHNCNINTIKSKEAHCYIPTLPKPYWCTNWQCDQLTKLFIFIRAIYAWYFSSELSILIIFGTQSHVFTQKLFDYLFTVDTFGSSQIKVLFFYLFSYFKTRGNNKLLFAVIFALGEYKIEEQLTLRP